jgi:hypothetical protein
MPGLRPPSRSRRGCSATPWSRTTSANAPIAASRPPKLLVGGAGYPDTSLCERREYRRYLEATGGRDYANEQRVRWGLAPILRPDLGPPAPER